MINDTLEVESTSGLHARSAKQLVEIADNFESDVQLTHNDVEADASSIREVMMLAASPGTRLEVQIEGPDETQAHEKIKDFFARGFYENESNV